jgi:CubicO group peptidase (beta-lactamase class C family)
MSAKNVVEKGRSMSKALKRISALCLVTLLHILTLTSSCGPFPSSAQEYWPGNEWRTSPPEAQGMDSAQLADMLTFIQKTDIRLHSLLVVRNGYLVLEVYYPPYNPRVRHGVASITKSVIGTLVGIAIQQGKIQSVEQKLVDFFPELNIQHLDEQKKSISVKNLLSMTPGLDCQDNSTPAMRMYDTDQWVQYLLDLPVDAAPGTKWIYCSGASHLLSAVIQNTTGMDARSFANQNLFTPLGVADINPPEWSSDPEGISNGIAGLYLTPRETAKYGYLYLKQGRWDRTQVVPSKWVHDSTVEQAFIGKDDYVGGLDRRFGYMWSVFPELGYYGYLGQAGQELFVIPEQEMVVVFNAALPLGKEARLLELLNSYIIPSATAKDSIKSDPQAAARLEALVRQAAGTASELQPLPPKAQEISGKTYQLEDNLAGWKSMALIFTPGASEAVLRLDGTQDLKIGLDNIYRLTEVPGGRPFALRGRWNDSGEFEMDYSLVGEALDSTAAFHFEGNQLDLSIFNLVYGGPSLRIKGKE